MPLMMSGYDYSGIQPDIELECGSIASFDYDSGISYRCNECWAVVGSIAMPRECKEKYDMLRVVMKLRK